MRVTTRPIARPGRRCAWSRTPWRCTVSRSASRVQDLVSRLVKTGYLEQRAALRDRRVRILTPTKKMIAQDQDFLVSHYLPLDILFPDPGYAPIMSARSRVPIEAASGVARPVRAWRADPGQQSDHDAVPGPRRRRHDPHQNDPDGRTARAAPSRSRCLIPTWATASACRAPMSASFWSRRKRWILFV